MSAPTDKGSRILLALVEHWRQCAEGIREEDDTSAGRAASLDECANDLHAAVVMGVLPATHEAGARQRAKVSAALLDDKLVRTTFGYRWLDAPEADRIAAIAVAALRGDS